MIKDKKVICTRSDLTVLGSLRFFTAGKVYEVQDIGMTNVEELGVILIDDAGELSVPLLMKGGFWDFEVVE